MKRELAVSVFPFFSQTSKYCCWCFSPVNVMKIMGVTGKEIQSRLNFFILSGDTLGFQSKVFHLKDPLLSEGGGGAKILKTL